MSLNTNKHVFVKLFNIIFESGLIQNVWSIRVIHPMFNNKGDSTDPLYYKPITLLSCLGKLFTAILITRLEKYESDYKVINNFQAGFRKGYSTVDNMFVLNTLIDILRANKKQLFCAFLDLKGAFDTVWRGGLWHKLINSKVNGNFLNIVRNMYQNAKSCVFANSKHSTYFNCSVVVRQGENLSPLLFSFYLNDLHDYFQNSDLSQGIDCNKHDSDDTVIGFVKLFILLYADDTAIVSESAADLQNALNIYETYCDRWKLTLNTSKTKIVIFSGGRQRNYNFTYKNETIEIVKDYKYLGIMFSRSCSFLTAKKHISNQAKKAMYCLIKRSKYLCLPIDLQIDFSIKLSNPFYYMVVKFGVMAILISLKGFN